MEALLAVLGVISLIGIFIVYGSFVWGFVVYKFYYWFAIWLIPGLPDITFWQAVAISCLLSLFKNHSSISIKEEYRDQTKEVVLSILNPWLFLFIGWIVQLIIK